MADSKAILSIDGGGIRGVIPAMVLHFLEEHTRRPTAELFDVIAGTSTGGLLALALSCPGEDGRPRYSAAQLVELYVERGTTIFPRETFGRLRQLADAKYPTAGIEAVLGEKFGEARLSDALTDVLVTAYDIERRAPVFFRSARAREAPERYDFRMRDIARATSAAPTYFEPLRLPARPPQADYTLVDGGVFANNPAMCAFVDDYTVDADVDATFMVSLGTGYLTRTLHYEDARGWGVLGWGRHVLDVVFDGTSDTVEYQLGKLLGDRYHRFQIRLEKACDDLDDADPGNVNDLKLAAEELIHTRREELVEVCELLSDRVAKGERSPQPGGAAPA